LITAQVHGPLCLRCTYSTLQKVGARASCCTAVRDAKAYTIQRCQVTAAAGYQLSGSRRAQPCSAGSAKAAVGGGKCGSCRGRTYQPSPRQRKCLTCPAGTRANAEHTACISYPPGTQPGPGNARRPCPAGELPRHL
jgi:hypothetical protein